MLLLALLQRWRPRAARRLELLALALPLPDALARLVVPPSSCVAGAWDGVSTTPHSKDSDRFIASRTADLCCLT